jgi:hypothetical protein
MVVSENGRVRWWRASERFDDFWIDTGSDVSPFTLAGAYFRGEVLPDEPQDVQTDAWLGDRASRVGESLYEVAISLGRYNQVISLLWPA